MKILMVAPTPFFADRGCHVRILGEIQGLQTLGHEVLTCTYPLGRDIHAARTVRTWPVPWYRKLSAGPSWHKYYIDLMLLSLVREQICRWKPDVIHAHLHEGAVLAVLARGRRRIPVVLDYQGSLTAEVVAHAFTRPGAVQHRWLRHAETWADHQADAIITSTGAAVKELIEEHGVPPERIHAITDGVDVAQFQPGLDGMEIRARFGVPAGRPLIVYTGLLSAYQGIDLLLEALASVRRAGRAFHALIVGYPDVEAYRAKADALGLQGVVTFPGRLPFEELPSLLAGSDIAVSAKLPGSEGNVKLYTYMSSGLPTVAFDAWMNREIMGDAGVLVPRVDAGALADSLTALLDQPERWMDLGRRARERMVREFSWSSVAGRMVEIYAKALGSTVREQERELACHNAL
jgi:glycosyltransferase involved in cell wall biosynthesis